MKTSTLLFLLFCLCVISCQSNEQQFAGDELEIFNVREASNEALKAHDIDQELSFLTDDIILTTGSGTQLCGKENLKAYITNIPNQKMYWIRTTDEIEVNQETNLAWETGTWKGYDPDEGPEPVVGGNYSAMWTRKEGIWKIKSELFVTLKP
jgi:ketosteroid isomerase-like protein